MIHGNAVRRSEDAAYESRSARRTTAEDLREQVRNLAPDLDPVSPTFQAAVLLLAALKVGQNIDRLARITGYDRSFVAKCARRLVDNGVWHNGRTVNNWYGSGGTHTAFWNDVAVGEGRMCRRINDAGEIEWAEAGVWRKNYDFVAPKLHLEPTNRYHSVRGADGKAAVAPRDDSDLAGRQAGVPLRRRKAAVRRRPLIPRLRIDARARPKRFRAASATAETRAPAAPAAPELFPGAQWLG